MNTSSQEWNKFEIYSNLTQTTSYMRQMTGREFVARIRRNPSWAKSLEEPLEVTTFANLDGTEITHLSPLITFRGRNKSGNVASFRNCQKLEIAEGTFDGFVDFGRVWIEKGKKMKEIPTGIKKIGRLRVLRPNDHGDAINLEGCAGVQHFKGTFPGAVFIGHNENIELINITVTKANNRGFALCISEAEVGKIEGKLKGTILLHFSRLRTLGDVKTEAGYEDKHLFLSVGSTIEDLGSPEEFPFEENQVGWEHHEEGDEIDQSLKEMLKIKTAIREFTLRQEKKRTLEPWGKRWKRQAFKSLAETLEVDDMLKQEGFKVDSKGRGGFLKYASTIICTLLLGIGVSSVTDIGRMYREEYMSKPIAEKIHNAAGFENKSQYPETIVYQNSYSAQVGQKNNPTPNPPIPSNPLNSQSPQNPQNPQNYLDPALEGFRNPQVLDPDPVNLDSSSIKRYVQAGKSHEAKKRLEVEANITEIILPATNVDIEKNPKIDANSKDNLRTQGLYQIIENISYLKEEDLKATAPKSTTKHTPIPMPHPTPWVDAHKEEIDKATKQYEVKTSKAQRTNLPRGKVHQTQGLAMAY